MQRMGIAIDREWLWRLGSDLDARKIELYKSISSYIPRGDLEQFVGESADEVADFNVESAGQMAGLLFTRLRIGAGERLKTTKSGKRISTGKKQLEGLKWRHPVIPLVLEYRECSKLKSTYADALPALARLHTRNTCALCGSKHLKDHWRVHTELPTTRTDTDRLASRRPNLQNIPARTKLGREIRKAFIGEEGTCLVAADYSQIELRLLADRAVERNMIRIFREGLDIHADTAMRAFDLDLATVLSDEGKLLYRAPCKNVNFGIVYGLSASGLYDLMMVTFATAGVTIPDWLTWEWCQEFIDKWFNLYPDAREYFELQHWRARRYGITWCLFGGVRRIPEVRSAHEKVVAAGLRQAGNNPIQRGAAGVMKIGMARVEGRLAEMRADGIWVEALLPIHDELIVQASEEWADEVRVIVESEMAKAMVDEETKELRCRVPIVTEGKVMTRWIKG
jgi:DNA polymerase I